MPNIQDTLAMLIVLPTSERFVLGDVALSQPYAIKTKIRVGVIARYIRRGRTASNVSCSRVNCSRPEGYQGVLKEARVFRHWKGKWKVRVGVIASYITYRERYPTL